MNKRKQVTEYILTMIGKITPNDDTNVTTLKSQLEGLSDTEFEDYIRRLGPANTPEEISKRECLPFYALNLTKRDRISVARNNAIAKEMGKSFTHRLIITDPITREQYVTPHPYPVYDTPIRRQAQSQYKKASIPDHDQKIDVLTDQPIALSKGSRISVPELSSLISRNLINTAVELTTIRGGNDKAYQEMKRNLINDGSCTLAQVDGLGQAKSTLTLSIFLNSMHLGNNVDPETPIPEDAL